MVSSIIITALVLFLAAGLIQIRRLNYKVRIHQERLMDKSLQHDQLLSQKKSSEIRTGQIAETLAPFLKDFPYNPKQAHFLGNPIDYVVFAKDEIVFVEIKSGKSKLTSGQRAIKQLIQDKNITWKEIRIE